MNDTMLKRKNPFIILLKGIGFTLLFQVILGISLVIGDIIEGNMDNLVHGVGGLNFTNHRVIAWMGLTMLLAGFPISQIIGKLAFRGRPNSFYFMESSWKNCLYGAVLGTLFPMAVVSTAFLGGHAKFIAGPERLIPQEIIASLLGYGLLMLFVGYYEEIISRGILCCEWAHTWGSWVLAITLSGLLFGIMHTTNIDATLGEKIRIILSGTLFSWLLAAVMLRFKSLKAAIGLHAGWNYGLGCIMGCSVSGQELNLSMFRTEFYGPDWITGGAFGIETSMPVNIILVVLIYLFVREINFSELRAEPKESPVNSADFPPDSTDFPGHPQEPIGDETTENP